ncbi:MAG: LCP family protein [Carbonactinosporaceae bacterium]
MMVGALLPGTGFLATGRRVRGALVLGTFLGLLGAGGWLLVRDRERVLTWLVMPNALAMLVVGLAAVTLLWVVVIAVTYAMVRPRSASWVQRLAGGGLVALLCAVVVAPLALAAQYAYVSRGLVDDIFAPPGTGQPDEQEADPWGGRDRVNFLLLGGDGGPGRVGIRTDTVIVASVDVHSGATVMFSLPRNLESLPFPEGSPLDEAYPEGFDGPGSEANYLLNAVYRVVPMEHPEILAGSADPGVEALKLGVGEALGLHIDHYALVNLEGFVELLDAIGGITVNVNEPVPIGGQPGQPPEDWIGPGPDRHLEGELALWYARGRYGSSDYDRMARQRCTIKAIVDQADPFTVLRSYNSVAASAKKMVSTDVPQHLLPALVDLVFKVRDSKVRNIVFDDTVIEPADPSYEHIREFTQEALHPTPTSPAPGRAIAGGDAGRAEGGDGPVQGLGDACAYDPDS